AGRAAQRRLRATATSSSSSESSLAACRPTRTLLPARVPLAPSAALLSAGGEPVLSSSKNPPRTAVRSGSETAGSCPISAGPGPALNALRSTVRWTHCLSANRPPSASSAPKKALSPASILPSADQMGLPVMRPVRTPATPAERYAPTAPRLHASKDSTPSPLMSAAARAAPTNAPRKRPTMSRFNMTEGGVYPPTSPPQAPPHLEREALRAPRASLLSPDVFGAFVGGAFCAPVVGRASRPSSSRRLLVRFLGPV